MELFHRYLSLAVEGGASDVHIKIGVPVVFRINSKLVNIEGPVPTAEWVDHVVEHLVPKHAKARMETMLESIGDVFFALDGSGRISYLKGCFLGQERHRADVEDICGNSTTK